jgi:hypothetical protein
MTDQGQQSVLTPEQIDRLEGIFHPFAKSRRERLYGVAPVARFVHYTTAEAALKIILSKRLWMRSTTAMADLREKSKELGLVDRPGRPIRKAPR